MPLPVVVPIVAATVSCSWARSSSTPAAPPASTLAPTRRARRPPRRGSSPRSTGLWMTIPRRTANQEQPTAPHVAGGLSVHDEYAFLVLRRPWPIPAPEHRGAQRLDDRPGYTIGQGAERAGRALLHSRDIFGLRDSSAASFCRAPDDGRRHRYSTSRWQEVDDPPASSVLTGRRTARSGRPGRQRRGSAPGTGGTTGGSGRRADRAPASGPRASERHGERLRVPDAERARRRASRPSAGTCRPRPSRTPTCRTRCGPSCRSTAGGCSAAAGRRVDGAVVVRRRVPVVADDEHRVGRRLRERPGVGVLVAHGPGLPGARRRAPRPQRARSRAPRSARSACPATSSRRPGCGRPCTAPRGTPRASCRTGTRTRAPRAAPPSRPPPSPSCCGRVPLDERGARRPASRRRRSRARRAPAAAPRRQLRSMSTKPAAVRRVQVAEQERLSTG